MRVPLSVAAVLLLAGLRAQAATVVIDDGDPPGQGLNDPTPFAATGGNDAPTLGAARLAVFNQAAAVWGARLSSAVPIHVYAQMVPLACNASSAVLGRTGTTTVHRDFPGAPRPATWYGQALANALSGADLDPSTPDMQTEFNSGLGTSGCLSGSGFYLGLDGHPPSGQIDMLTIALHEFAHGLGFQSYTDFSTGAKLAGLDDAFLADAQENGVTPAALSTMTDAQRVGAAVSDPNLYWVGAAVQGAAGALSAGLASGHVRLHAPATLSPGSSVSHFSTALAPNQLMEPFYTAPIRDLTLTRDLLQDLGWPAQAAAVPAGSVGSLWLLVLGLTGAGGWAMRRGRRRRAPARARSPAAGRATARISAGPRGTAGTALARGEKLKPWITTSAP
ncbi:MAG TPA: hypothetical protein VHM31_22140 [Polyangia bacterium]|nr:hypothetical protein [Polyangia bacterium]